MDEIVTAVGQLIHMTHLGHISTLFPLKKK